MNEIPRFSYKKLPRYDKLSIKQIRKLLKDGCTHFRARQRKGDLVNIFNNYKKLVKYPDHKAYRYEVEFPGGWFEMTDNGIEIFFDILHSPKFKRIMFLADDMEIEFKNYILSEEEQHFYRNRTSFFSKIVDDIARGL